MKIRQGFVSNSSSSSFVVIGNTPSSVYRDEYDDEDIIFGLDGETEFGWDHRKYYGLDTRINFAYLQTDCGKNKDWLEMLERVILNYTGANSIDWRLTDDWKPAEGYVTGYIDHQSHASEGENIEIFNDDETLERFIFSDESYIQGGNDNC